MPPALIVAGPTCSGKSALALALAARFGGTVINADAMQVYAELRILTARPTPAETAAIPHALYGVRPAAAPGSAAWWRAQALAEMQAAHDAGRVPILCGGTGMYLASLTQGIAAIPDAGEPARQEARALLAALGAPGLHARLAAIDPATAARLRPQDSQRIARAWEVLRGTGAGLAAWQDAPPIPPAWRFAAVLLDPPRAALRAAIAERFRAMLAAGAPDEVAALLAQNLDPALPAMRAHGVPELAAHLRGGTTLDQAAARAILATGQYTKRQATWFRHHPLAEPALSHTIDARYADPAQFPESLHASLAHFVRRTG